MRVIAGQARSLKLVVPAGTEVRPTTDRKKETLFNMMNHFIYGSRFLDVFAGSGSIGIEALSRGAKEATFVESSPKALVCIESNLKHTKLGENAEIYRQEYQFAFTTLHQKGKCYDIIFLDPPYNKGHEEVAISRIYELKLLAEDGFIVCESDIQTSFQFIDQLDEFSIDKEKVFKTNKFTFIRFK